MTTLTFSTGKQAFLIFTAEGMEISREADGMLLVASGEITQQDTQMLEERIALPVECHVNITEAGADVVSERFTVSFVAVEPNQLVARLG